MNTQRKNIALSPELALLKMRLAKFTWSRHAAEQAAQRGILLTDTVLATSQGLFRYGQIVELEHHRGWVDKVVIRFSYLPTHDIVLVLAPVKRAVVVDNVLTSCTGTWAVLTCWLNAVTDKHHTLQLARIA